MAFSTFFASVHQVPAGHIGVVYEFGGIKGQIGEGLQFVAPWRDVLLANIQVQRRVFDKLNAFSEESQDVFVRATLNVRVSPQTVQELYRTVRPNLYNVLIESRVIQNFKDETVKYKSVEIAPNRENIRKAVRERLEKELSPFSIEVVDLLLDNIDFNPEFKKAIEDKQIATQRALEEQQKIEGENHKAQQAIQRAKGEGGAVVSPSREGGRGEQKIGCFSFYSGASAVRHGSEAERQDPGYYAALRPELHLGLGYPTRYSKRKEIGRPTPDEVVGLRPSTDGRNREGEAAVHGRADRRPTSVADDGRQRLQPHQGSRRCLFSGEEGGQASPAAEGERSYSQAHNGYDACLQWLHNRTHPGFARTRAARHDVPVLPSRRHPGGKGNSSDVSEIRLSVL